MVLSAWDGPFRGCTGPWYDNRSIVWKNLSAGSSWPSSGAPSTSYSTVIYILTVTTSIVIENTRQKKNDGNNTTDCKSLAPGQ